MAHFAKINEQGIVERVVVVSNNELLDFNGSESELKGISFCQNLFGGNWVQTSYNSNFRKNYAGEGFQYDHARDAFIAPKTFPSWVLDEETCRWIAPVPYPSDGKYYKWDEETTSWKEIIYNDPL